MPDDINLAYIEGSLLADLPLTLQGQRSYYYGEQVHGGNMQKVQKKSATGGLLFRT